MSTGIAVFAYDRPVHLERVLSGLESNGVEHIYVFADGPSEKPGVAVVRKVIDAINWCETTVVARDENLGLARSVVRGVDRVFEDHDRIIVLEDDCVPSPHFVELMNTCFDSYEDDPQVMNVTGFGPPIDVPERYPYDVYFTHRSCSWGWGTWKSAWERFEHEPMTLVEFRNREDELRTTTRKAGYDISTMLRRQLRGKIDSWAVWWVWAIINAGGVCVNPVQSRIKNIGFDKTGTHGDADDNFAVKLSDQPAEGLRLPDNVTVDRDLNRRYNRFFGGGRLFVYKHWAGKWLKRLG